jgi:hypothetical protein
MPAIDLDQKDRPVPIKGYIKRDLLIHVSGAGAGLSLAGYRFFLVWLDPYYSKVYTIPKENLGPILPRTFKPNPDGVIYIKDCYWRYAPGAIFGIAAYTTDPLNRPDLKAKTPYDCRVHGNAMLFYVEPITAQGSETTQWSGSETLKGDVVNIGTNRSTMGKWEGGLRAGADNSPMGGGFSAGFEITNEYSTQHQAPSREANFTSGRQVTTPFEIAQRLRITQRARPIPTD